MGNFPRDSRGMRPLARDLLAEIEAFLADSGLTPTKFGLAAVNDGHLVANLRRGHSVTLKTADRVRAFMRQRSGAGSAAAAKPGAAAGQPPAGIFQVASAGRVPAAELPDKSIALIMGGGIAAYKCLDLIRRLRERRIGVRAIM